MAEFFQKRGKRHDDDVLGSAVNFLLANARLVLGVGGAAVLGIATLAVKRVRPWWLPEEDHRAGACSGALGGGWGLPTAGICFSTQQACWLCPGLCCAAQASGALTCALCLQLIDRAASSQDEDDAKADATSLEDSWKELSLLKAAPRPQPRPSLAAHSQPVLLPVPSLFAPGEWHPFPSNLVGPPLVVTLRRCSPGSATDRLCPVQAPLPPGVWAPCMFHGVLFCPSVNHGDMWTLG